MMRFLLPHYIAQHDLEKLACAFVQADGLNPYAYVSVPGTLAYMFGQQQSMPLWQTYLPKVLEFLQMKLVYDATFPQPVKDAAMAWNTPVSEIPLLTPLPDMDEKEILQFKQLVLDEAKDPNCSRILFDTVRQLAKNHKIKKYPLRTCGICETPLYYEIAGDYVSYQPGCNCSRHWGPAEPRSFADLTECFNIQSNPEIRARMLREFINAGENPG